MKRGFPPCLAVLFLACVPAAQAQPADPIKLTVRPAPAPVPALRYQLTPEVRDQTPGNAALLYYRAFSPEWAVDRRPEVSKLIDKWTEDPHTVPDKDLA